MKSLLICSILLVYFVQNGYAQVFTKDSISHLLVKLTKSEAEKRLVGAWVFVQMTSPQGNIIDSIFAGSLEDEEYAIPEKVVEPSFVFYRDKRYERNDTDSLSFGRYSYDDRKRELVFKFDKPADIYRKFDSTTKSVFDILKIKPNPIDVDIKYINQLTYDKLVFIQICDICLHYKYSYVVYKRK